MVDGAPQIMCFAANLYEDLIDMPAPIRMAARLYPVFSDFRREDWTEAVPPMAHAFMADIDATLVQPVFDMPKRQRITDVHHHRQLDDLWRCFDIAEERFGHHEMMLELEGRGLKPDSSDKPAAGTLVGQQTTLKLSLIKVKNFNTIGFIGGTGAKCRHSRWVSMMVVSKILALNWKRMLLRQMMRILVDRVAHEADSLMYSGRRSSE